MCCRPARRDRRPKRADSGRFFLLRLGPAPCRRGGGAGAVPLFLRGRCRTLCRPHRSAVRLRRLAGDFGLRLQPMSVGPAGGASLAFPDRVGSFPDPLLPRRAFHVLRLSRFRFDPAALDAARTQTEQSREVKQPMLDKSRTSQKLPFLPSSRGVCSPASMAAAIETRQARPRHGASDSAAILYWAGVATRSPRRRLRCRRHPARDVSRAPAARAWRRLACDRGATPQFPPRSPRRGSRPIRSDKARTGRSRRRPADRRTG